MNTANSTLVQSAYQQETASATPVSVATVSLPSDTTTTLDVEARCVQVGADKTKVFNIRRHFLNDGGTIVASTQENISGPDELGGALSAAVNILHTGTTARVEITGLPATSLRWRVDLQSVQMTAAASSAYDPATAVLTGWGRAGSSWTDGGGGFAGVWTGTASAGSSGSRNFNHASTNLPTPANGAALNSLVGPDFNGIDDRLYGSPVASSNYWSTASGGVFVAALIRADAAASDPGAGSRRNAPAIVAEDNANVGLHYHAGGVTFALVTNNGGGTLYEITRACSTGAWHSVVAWWSGTHLNLVVDGVAATPVATAGSALNTLSGSFVIGKNFLSTYFDGRIYDLITATSAVFTGANHVSYVNNRYGLAL